MYPSCSIEPQYLIAADAGEVGWRSGLSRLGELIIPGDRRHFADRQIARLLREVVFGGLPDAVDAFLAALPQVDIVDIVLEDLVLAVELRSAIYAISASLILRRQCAFWVRKKFFINCWVRVEPPWRT